MQYTFRNGQWEFNSPEDGEADETVDWAQHDEIARQQRDARFHDLRRAQSTCNSATDPEFKSALQSVIDEEVAKLSRRVFAP